MRDSLPPTPALPEPNRQGYASRGSAKLWYGEYGPDTGGTPVLLLHGGLASSRHYGYLIAALVTAGTRVVAMDSRGHGRSTASDEPYTYDLMTGDVIALLDHLDIAKADIVGWSDGGILGFKLAIAAPERVDRVLAFGTNATLDALAPGFDETPTFAAYIERSADEYREAAPEPEAYPAFLDGISEMWGTNPFGNVAELAAIQAPVTVLLAQYDEAISVLHGAEMADIIPDANLVVLPNVSHFALLQRPAQFNDAVIAFLKWR